MLHIYGADQENGADKRFDGEEHGRSRLSPPLQLPKNRSTGNLALAGTNSPEKARIRFSFDAGPSAAEYDAVSRGSSLMTDHDHGLGLSGLRRIRQQHNPLRTPTLPSPYGQTSSFGSLSRSPSVNMPLPSPSHGISGPASPAFTEDLSRFPSESLHSFSFAHQAEDFLHSRQNVLKRSMEFMKDRFGWSVSDNAGLASAQARVSGDVEMQHMLDLLAKAQLVGAGNLPNADPAMILGPLSGPAYSSGENVFDKQFVPRSASPEPIDDDSLISPLDQSAPSTPNARTSSEAWRTRRSSDSTGSRQRQSIQGSEDRDSRDSEDSSRTPTNESGTTAKTSPPTSRRPSLLKRTLTDTVHVSMQQRLMNAMAKPFLGGSGSSGGGGESGLLQEPLSPILPPQLSPAMNPPASMMPSAVHGHATRWVPAAQAIFTTESKPPWTILSANDLACLVFGVTKAEVRKIGILEVVQEERRAWLERKLQKGSSDPPSDGSESEISRSSSPAVPTTSSSSSSSNLLGARAGGITAKLLSKPNSRSQSAKNNGGRRPATVHSGDPKPPKPGHAHHDGGRSRGVLLCGDVVPILKRNGATGSASLWVKEKRVGLIWVLEEIHEDVAMVDVDEDGIVMKLSGALGPIWGDETLQPGIDLGKLVPRIPRQGIDPRYGELDYAQIAKRKYFTCRHGGRINIPATIEQVRGSTELRVSSFPHIAGIVVVCTRTLTIKSSNSVFCGALFGYERPDGMSITSLVPNFDQVLRVLTEEDGIQLVDGIVVPEHSFRKASAVLALKEGRRDAPGAFLGEDGLPARHRDGSELKIDVQMRMVKSEKQPSIIEETLVESTEEEDEEQGQKKEHKQGQTQEEEREMEQKAKEDERTTKEREREHRKPTPDASRKKLNRLSTIQSESVYALWITYSRHLHAIRSTNNIAGAASPLLSGTATPLHQPSPGQTPAHTPLEIQSDSDEPRKEQSTASLIAKQLKGAAMTAAAKLAVVQKPFERDPNAKPAMGTMMTTTTTTTTTTAMTTTTTTMVKAIEPPAKKSIDDFVILEDMGQGAYGQVKLARYRNSGKKCVLKYVTKRRILVDTWTRDRRLGTVPLEIHVLDYLRRDGLKHPNIVEMEDFFEDDVNYYIEMVPHGLPGMDLFDYIELRTNMEERECRSIFVQVARAVHHLHTRALVVHRDIKDENVVLDGEGNIKLIDFGSAAYIKSGPFDVFVGTIDYAAPEVLAGKPYGGREQDVWALGILLYTIIYKENPFYSIDEIMDRDLRVPYTISDESIDLVRRMLNRDVEQRYTIEQVVQHPWCVMELESESD